MATDEVTPTLEGAHTADQIRTYVLRSDAIAPCSVADVHAIPQALKDIEAYWLGTVPCRNVRLVGILISATEYESRSIYSIDDGTASISCLKKRSVRLEIEQLAEGSPFLQSREYQVGDTVSVVGKIEAYKGVRQIYISSIMRCTSPDAESRHLLDILERHRTVYSQPFVIPPLPVPSTPRKQENLNSQPTYASSIASSPTTTSYSSPVRPSQKKEQTRLRHPSRLRSKDLNENVFRMYLSHVVISTLSVPESAPEDPLFNKPEPENLDGSIPRLSGARRGTNSPDTTPKRPSRVLVDPFGSPTPKKQVSYSLDSPKEPSGQVLGVTLSYLRRVQVLGDLARRVVEQAAHERDKALRHAERNARAKYEALNPSTSQTGSSRIASSGSTVKATTSSRSQTSSRTSQTTTSSKFSEENSTTDAKSSRSQRSTNSKRHHSSSSRISSALSVSSSHSKSQHTVPLTPEEADRRAAYHAKQSKLHAEDKQKRSVRTKRLFESALRTLVSEGELTVYEGPRRRVPTSSKPAEISAFHNIWPDVTNTTTSSGRTMSTASSALSGLSCSDLDTISEDDTEPADPLSDPSDSEDAYIPITPQTLRPAMLSALRRTLMRHRGGADFDSWMRTLRGDGQWARVPDLVLKETLEVMREEDWIAKVGGGRWDFTRGGWTRSLQFS